MANDETVQRLLSEVPIPPTIVDLRELLSDLRYEVGNRLEPDAALFAYAYRTLGWLVDEYLKPRLDV